MVEQKSNSPCCLGCDRPIVTTVNRLTRFCPKCQAFANKKSTKLVEDEDEVRPRKKIFDHSGIPFS